MNYVNFNNFQPSSANTFSKEDARVAILMVETKNPKAAEKMVANLDETNNQLKDIVALVENKLAILDALKVARANNELKALNEAYEAAKAENLESFEFKGQTFKVINESKEEQVEEKFRYTEDDINTLYGFYGTLETNFKKKDVERMYTEGVDGLMKAYKISEKVAIAILDSKIGRHLADMIYDKQATDAVDALAKYFGSGARVWNYITSMVRLEEALMTEAGDHEVGMANGQLADIVKNAQELMSKIGTTEKDIPGWIQDHISQAQNYINQANSNYHELEESVIDEAYDWGTYSTPEGSAVAKVIDKAYNKFSSEVSKAFNAFKTTVKDYSTGSKRELGDKSGFNDSEGQSSIAYGIRTILNNVFEINTQNIYVNADWMYESRDVEVNEMKKPKTWDSQFAMKAIDAYEAGEFDPEDDKSLADWEKEYNGGKKPNPGFDTYNIIAYALMTGKKPDGTPIKESVNEAEVDLWTAIETDFTQLYSKLNDLAEETTDSKWRKAIQGIISGLDGVETKISQASNRLGVIPVYEAWIGPFQFNDKMSDEELKKMYDDALSGYANWQKGLTHPKSDYKKAYQEIAKILKARGVKVDESVEEALKSSSPNDVIAIDLDMAWDPADEKEAKAAFKKYKIKVNGTGEPGTYEVTGKKKDILAYLQSEFYEMDDEDIKEFYPELLESYGSGMGLSKVQTKKVAETLAKAISKHDGVNCTVNAKTLEEDSFDLDIDGELGAAGSYNIYDDGSVVNHAVTPNEIYGNYKSTVEEFVRGLKKPIYESVSTNEAKEIEVSLRYARLANDVFDDMYRRLGKKTSTNTFKMNSDDLADDFTQSLLDAGIPQEEIYEGWRPMTDEEKAEKQRKDQQLKRLRDADKKSADSKRLRDLQSKMHQDRLKKSNQ